MLFRGQVVAEYEVKLILAVPHPRDRRDRVVRLAACLGDFFAAMSFMGSS